MDSRTLFGAGAGIGLVIALATALGPLNAGVSHDDAAAVIGDGVVTRTQVDRAVEALSADNRNPVGPADRARVLDRLIDEEALVQRGIELGLPASDLAVRKAMVDAMLQFAVADGGDRAPTEAELRAFYDARPALFATEPRLRVQAATLPAYNPATVAAITAALNAGTPLVIAARSAGATPLTIPDTPLAASRLAALAGPTVRDTALGLEVGETGGATAPDGRLVIVHLSERSPGTRAPFETVRPAVDEAWRRVTREQALDRYLTTLRRELRVTKTGG